MKMILAIVSKDDAGKVSGNLTEAGFAVTKLSTTGGFLRAGNTTFLIGTEEAKVDTALEIISHHSKKRTQFIASNVMEELQPHAGSYNSYPVEITVGGATVFVLNVERFEKM